jgi:hypothetical protein
MSAMKIVLLRVGIDSGSGGIQGPVFANGTFEFLPIPDESETDPRTYGNTLGRYGRALVEYFPARRQLAMATQQMHVDPEFETYTYGDPAVPKGGLRKLLPGDILVFYAGLQGWNHEASPGLYIVGYFVVKLAGRAKDLPDATISEEFFANFHVRHPSVFRRDRSTLVLVKGGPESRLLKRAICISCIGKDSRGAPLKRLSDEAVRIFGDFGGRTSIQRSPPRWVAPEFVATARDFLTTLR